MAEMDKRRTAGAILSATSTVATVVIGLTVQSLTGVPAMIAWSIVGALLLLGLALWLLPDRWWRRLFKAVSAEPVAPAVSIVGNENITAINPVNSQTAHTIVNEAPLPQFLIRSSSNSEDEAGIWTTIINAEVVSPYPAANLYLEAHSEGIDQFDVAPQRSGAFTFGHTGKRVGMCFTNVQQAYGHYKITVRSRSNHVELKHAFD